VIWGWPRFWTERRGISSAAIGTPRYCLPPHPLADFGCTNTTSAGPGMRNLIWPIAAVTLALSGCGGSASSNNSDAQVVAFHQQLDSGNYDAVYKAAGSELKTSMSQQDFVRLLTAVHTKLGKSVKSELVQTTSMAGTNGSSTTLTYQTDFERGRGVETFVYNGDGPTPVLASYNINSYELIVN
jgi:hypothetical protein